MRGKNYCRPPRRGCDRPLKRMSWRKKKEKKEENRVRLRTKGNLIERIHFFVNRTNNIHVDGNFVSWIVLFWAPPPTLPPSGRESLLIYQLPVRRLIAYSCCMNRIRALVCDIDWFVDDWSKFPDPALWSRPYETEITIVASVIVPLLLQLWSSAAAL